MVVEFRVIMKQSTEGPFGLGCVQVYCGYHYITRRSLPTYGTHYRKHDALRRNIRQIHSLHISSYKRLVIGKRNVSFIEVIVQYCSPSITIKPHEPANRSVTNVPATAYVDNINVWLVLRSVC